MKFKKLAAVVLSAATLAASPSLPVVRCAVPETAVTAEAADTYINQVTRNNLTYKLYRDSSGMRYAVLTACAAGLTGAAVPASVTYGNYSYPVKLVKSGAFSNSNIKGISFSSADLTIESGAFSNTSKLETVTAQSSVQALTIRENAFYSSSIQTFNCYAVNCYIYNSAFGESMLNTVLFGVQTQSVNLYENAMADTKKLTKVMFYNSGVQLTLGNYAFSESSVRDLSLPSSVTTIPIACFENCTNLVNLSLPSTLTTIKGNAFRNAVLPSAMAIPANTSNINSTAFQGARNVSAYYVNSANPNYKSVNGVMYTKNGKTLCAYPANKADESFVSDCESIWVGAISYTKNLKTLNLPKFRLNSSNNTDFSYNSKLESVTVKSTESTLSGEAILSIYGSFFKGSKVRTFNGKAVLKDTPDSQEPDFTDDFKDYILANFEKYPECSFMKEYVDKMATYVVGQETTSSMTPLMKAVRLHQWICERVIYDPDVSRINRLKESGQSIPSGLSDTDKNHVDASVFLHKKSDGKYYTVCDGYARAYKILMDKAGIPTDYVTGPNIFSSNACGHSWNLVKLDGKWYHVDVTWDDGHDMIINEEYTNGMVPDDNLRSFKGSKWRYDYFLKSDQQFRNDKHSHYAWVSREHPELNWLSSAATDSTLSARGDLDLNGLYDSSDTYRMQQLATGQQANTDEKKRADIDGNGYVNSTDRSLLNEYINSHWWELNTLAGWRFSLLEK